MRWFFEISDQKNNGFSIELTPNPNYSNAWYWRVVSSRPGWVKVQPHAWFEALGTTDVFCTSFDEGGGNLPVLTLNKLFLTGMLVAVSGTGLLYREGAMSITPGPMTWRFVHSRKE